MLIDRSVIENAERVFYKDNSGLHKESSTFAAGIAFAEQQLQPMFVEFAKFVNMNFGIAVSNVEPLWCNLNTMGYSTTEELFNLWLEELNLQPIYQQIIDTVGGEEEFCKLAGI